MTKKPDETWEDARKKTAEMHERISQKPTPTTKSPTETSSPPSPASAMPSAATPSSDTTATKMPTATPDEAAATAAIKDLIAAEIAAFPDWLLPDDQVCGDHLRVWGREVRSRRFAALLRLLRIARHYRWVKAQNKGKAPDHPEYRSLEALAATVGFSSSYIRRGIQVLEEVEASGGAIPLWMAEECGGPDSAYLAVLERREAALRAARETANKAAAAAEEARRAPDPEPVPVTPIAEDEAEDVMTEEDKEAVRAGSIVRTDDVRNALFTIENVPTAFDLLAQASELDRLPMPANVLEKCVRSLTIIAKHTPSGGLGLLRKLVNMAVNDEANAFLERTTGGS